MAIADLGQVLSSADMRSQLGATLERFRSGSNAPVAFGAHRRAEAVIVPASEFEDLLNLVEDLQIAAQARDRIAAGGQEVDFEQWVDGMGLGQRG